MLTRRGAAVLRVRGAVDQPGLLEPREHARDRRALDALALGQLGRRQRPVALDRRERRGLGRAEPGARLLAQPARHARDVQAQAGGEVGEGSGTHG